MWALVVSNIASLALLLHHYINQASDSVKRSGANGARQPEDEKSMAEPTIALDVVINLELYVLIVVLAVSASSRWLV